MAEGLVIRVGADVEPAISNINKFTGAVSKIGPGSQTARNGVIELSHAFRDLPFALQNPAILTSPIDKLVESFTSLRSQTGSTKSALATLGSALTGGAGLMIAFDFVTAGISLFGSKLLEGSRNAKKAKADADEYSKALEGIGNKLADEATRVSELVAAIQSENTSRGEKIVALNELKRISPEYFGQLKEEKGLINGLANAYQIYIQALKSQFAAKALDKQLSALFDKKLTLEVALDPSISTAANKELNSRISSLQGEFDKLGGIKAFNAIPIDKQNLTDGEKRLRDIQGILIQLKSTPVVDLTGQAKQLEAINKEIDGLLSRRTEFGHFDLKPEVTLKPKVKKEDKPRDALPAIVSLKGDIEDQIKKELGDIDIAKALNAKRIHSKLDFGDTFLSAETLDRIGQALLAFDKLQAKAALVESVLVNDLGPAFTTLFSDIASGSKNAFQSFVQSIGEVIKKLIAAAITAAIFAAIISVVGGGAAKGGEGFLEAFKRIGPGFGLPKFASGGIVTGPTTALVGEAGPEAIFPLSQLNKFMSNITPMGGNSGFVASTELSGTNLKILINRIGLQPGTSFR